MKIRVKPEGRDGVYIPDRESLKAFIQSRGWTEIHNMIQGWNPGVMIGADHEIDAVLENIDAAKKVAVLTGKAFEHNWKHALAVVSDQLDIYDIGEITDADLEVLPP